MTRTLSIAPVRKSITVKASAEHAFDVFTAGIDRWWPKSHHIAESPIVASIIEPFVGGRWYTRSEDGSEVTVGHVRAWQPGVRFTVSWAITAAWKPEARAEYASEVDVQFTALADGTTRVDLEHRDFQRMGSLDGQTMRDQVDQGWPGLLHLYTAALTPAA